MKHIGMLLASFALVLSSFAVLDLGDLPGSWLAQRVAAANEEPIEIHAPGDPWKVASPEPGWSVLADASGGRGDTRSAFVAAAEEEAPEQPGRPTVDRTRSLDMLPMRAVAPHELPEDLVIRLPMEDQFHSQLTETALPNACGPTALLMVLDYFGFEESLESVIGKHQFSPERGGYDPRCSANPVCTSPDALVAVAQGEYGLKVESHEAWTFEDIGRSLASGRPLIADVVWQLAEDGPGHFVVIFGIDTARRTITYHDPYDGANQSASWEDFAAAWDGPVDEGDPLQPEGHRFWAMEIAID